MINSLHVNFQWQKLGITFSFKVQKIWVRGGEYGNFISVQQSNKKIKALQEMSLWQLILCCAVSFLLHFFIGVVRGLQQQPEEVLEQQDRQFLRCFSQVSTFFLSDRPRFITKSCHFLTCTIAMDGEKRVGGSWVKWWRLSTCQ